MSNALTEEQLRRLRAFLRKLGLDPRVSADYRFEALACCLYFEDPNSVRDRILRLEHEQSENSARSVVSILHNPSASDDDKMKAADALLRLLDD